MYIGKSILKVLQGEVLVVRLVFQVVGYLRPMVQVLLELSDLRSFKLLVFDLLKLALYLVV